MFSSKFWLVTTVVLATIFLGLFGPGYTWQGAICFLAVYFNNFLGFAVIRNENKEANFNLLAFEEKDLSRSFFFSLFINKFTHTYL